MHIGAFFGINMWLFSVGYFNYPGDKFGFSTRNDSKLYEKLLETLREK